MVITLTISFLILIGAMIFLYYRQTARTPEQITRYTSKYVNISGHNIHFIQEGKGPHIVLLHGIGASTFTWRFLVGKLAQNYTVTAIDLLGFGLSDKPKNFSYSIDDQCLILNEFFNKFNMKQIRIIASSMGGAIGLWYAKLNPQRVFEVVTISPALDPSFLRFDLQKLQFLGPMVSPLVTRAFIRQVMKRVVNRSDLINDETVEAYYSPYSKPDAIQSFIKSISVLRDTRLPGGLKGMTTPVLMIWGAQDKVVPVSVGKSIQKKLPQVQLLTHPTAGHHVMEEDPDWVFEQVSAFFDTRPE